MVASGITVVESKPESKKLTVIDAGGLLLADLVEILALTRRLRSRRSVLEQLRIELLQAMETVERAREVAQAAPPSLAHAAQHAHLSAIDTMNFARDRMDAAARRGEALADAWDRAACTINLDELSPEAVREELDHLISTGTRSANALRRQIRTCRETLALARAKGGAA